jgi:glycosyltransferase involved in cell wall biosynthesis
MVNETHHRKGSMPTVSVIIPTYNRAQFVTEAIESVLGQSYDDFELIIIDDGSEDDTQERFKRFANRIRYQYQENRGISHARNAGLRLAQAGYIAFLDSDDLWAKDKLARQIDYMENHPDHLICYTDEIWIRNGVRVNPKRIHGKHSGWIFQHCIPLCIISLSSAMMRKDLFDKVGIFDKALPVCEDYDLWLRASLVTAVGLVPEPLIIKRGGHSDQLSRTYWGMDRFRIIALEKILRDPRLNNGQRNLVIQDIIRRCRIVALGSHKRKKMEEWEMYHHKLQYYESLLK